MPESVSKYILAMVLGQILGCSNEPDYLGGYSFDQQSVKFVVDPGVENASTLTELYPEDWEQAVFFGPYTSAETISAALDGEWTTYVMELSDNVILVVFIDTSGRVVHSGVLPSRVVDSGRLSGDRFVRASRKDVGKIFFRNPERSVTEDDAWILAPPPSPQ